MPDVGEVRYSAKIDLDDLNSSIKKAETTIENSDLGDSLAKNIGEGAEKGSEDIQGAAQSIEKSNSSINKSSGAMSVAVGNAMAMAGQAVLSFAGQMVDVAVDYESASGKMQAATGLSSKEMEKYNAVMEDVYANNYGESFNDIADAMSAIRQQIGGVVDSWSSEGLQTITEDAFALRDAFGYAVEESVRAAKALMEMGVDGHDAMNLIATGAQNGLDFSGELLDSISEYSVQFDKVGLSAEDMFKIFQTGAESGAFNLDKVGDAVKELSIRVIDGSETTKEGFELIGLNADEMAAKFAAGGESAREAFFQTMEGLASLEDPLAQNQAGVDLLGTMWEDLGPSVVNSLSEIGEEAYATGDALETIKDVQYNDLGSSLESLKRSLETLLLPLTESLVPIITDLINVLLPPLQELLDPITQTLEAILEPLGDIIEALAPIISLIADALTPILQMVGDVCQSVFSSIADSVSSAMESITPLLENLGDFIQNVLMPIIDVFAENFVNQFSWAFDYIMDIVQYLLDLFSGVIDFIAGVFTGDWERAWQGIVDIFKTIINLVPTILENVINYAINFINGIINGINDVTSVVGISAIPNIPSVSIPRLKAGIDFVPTDFFPAFLDKGEMVLTAEEAAAYRNFGGSQAIDSTQYGNFGKGETVINVPLYLDSREVARATAWYTGEQLEWEQM